MAFLDSYRDRMGSKTNGVRERKVKDAQDRAVKHFEDDPSFFAVKALAPDNPIVLTKKIRVINESVLKQLNPERVYSKYIIPHPLEPMVSGTILYSLYEVDWIVTAVTGLGGVHQQAVLQKLNEIITVKMETSIFTLPASVNGVSRLGDGLLEMNLYTIPDELLKIRVQNNLKSRAVSRDTRIKIGSKMYVVTKIDLYTDDGVINWIAKEDLLEPDDYDDTPIGPPVVGTILGPDSISRARDYTFSAPTGVVLWTIQGTTPDVVGIKSMAISSAVIRAEKTQLITFTLIATYANNTTISKDIRLVSLL